LLLFHFDLVYDLHTFAFVFLITSFLAFIYSPSVYTFAFSLLLTFASVFIPTYALDLPFSLTLPFALARGRCLEL
jgi:hypothetical protein